MSTERVQETKRDLKRVGVRISPLPGHRHTLRCKEGDLTNRISIKRNTVNPTGSLASGYETARASKDLLKYSGGKGRGQEAKAISRKTTGNHNRMDRAIPKLKGC
jgi:hypothetical protein